MELTDSYFNPCQLSTSCIVASDADETICHRNSNFLRKQALVTLLFFILIDTDVKDLRGSCETTNKRKIRVSRLQFEEIGICLTFYRNNL